MQIGAYDSSAVAMVLVNNTELGTLGSFSDGAGFSTFVIDIDFSEMIGTNFGSFQAATTCS